MSNSLQVREEQSAMRYIDQLAKTTNEFANTSKEAIRGLTEAVNAGFTEVKSEIKDLKVDIEETKRAFDLLPLQSSDIDRITKAKNNRVVSLLGGKKSNAYVGAKDNKGKMIRQRVYSDINIQIQREFGVSSYKYIKSNQTHLVLDFINKYELPYELSECVKFANSQMSLDDY